MSEYSNGYRAAKTWYEARTAYTVRLTRTWDNANEYEAKVKAGLYKLWPQLARDLDALADWEKEKRDV